MMGREHGGIYEEKMLRGFWCVKLEEGDHLKM